MGTRLADSEHRLRRGWLGRTTPWAEYGLGLLVIFAGMLAAVLLVAGAIALLALLASRS